MGKSYLGAKRVRGKQGRGAAGKTTVFGLLKRDGKVFVSIVPNCSRDELMLIIQGKIIEGSTIHTDGWKAYDGLLLNDGYDLSIVSFIAKTNSQKERVTSMESRLSRASPRGTWQNTMV